MTTRIFAQDTPWDALTFKNIPDCPQNSAKMPEIPDLSGNGRFFMKSFKFAEIIFIL